MLFPPLLILLLLLLLLWLLLLSDAAVYRALHSKLRGHYSHLSRQKFSSNVIEKCLRVGEAQWRDDIVEELIRDGLLYCFSSPPLFLSLFSFLSFVCLLTFAFLILVLRFSFRLLLLFLCSILLFFGCSAAAFARYLFSSRRQLWV
jgi:hypothetical protein